MTARLAFLVWFIVGAVMLAAVLVAPSARADGFSGCEHRSVSHQLEHGGLRADSDWHVAHGDLPTCDPEKKSESKHDSAGQGKDRGKDNKSRYCRKRWYC
ncbi:site-specific recombination directionality factor RDF [Mycobacterium phage Nhonho]|uniref:site-specific recombination directionality factor RDF n=1 Tax=Mycobacterium phage Nhonho TaxID=1675553 RepID=UPI0006A28547|nr:site-specific recombination directionality factor RDF [Mycobacterium phage Nhonho]AKU45468.1 hypothetical protein NHONHO_72 [Mycobacterium phage Nhonho]